MRRHMIEISAWHHRMTALSVRVVRLVRLIAAQIKYFHVCFVLCSTFTPAWCVLNRPKLDLSAPYDFGVILLGNSTQLSDFRNIAPAIDVAISDVAAAYSLILTPWYRLYANHCDSVATWYSVAQAVDVMLNNNPILVQDGPDPQYWYYDPQNNVVGQMLLGPGCASDYQSVTMATQKIMSVLMTGRAESVYSTQDRNFTVRTGYNVYSMWHILTQGMAAAYNWTSIAGLYNTSDPTAQTHFDTLRLNVAGGDVRGFIPPHRDGIPGGKITEIACDLYPDTPNNNDRNAAIVLDCLNRASLTSRIIALLLSPTYVRHTMIIAQKSNLTNAEYLYLVVDPLRDTFINVAKPVWQNDDSDDAIAKVAFTSLFVISMAPFENNEMYLDLAKRAANVSRVKYDGTFSMNFFVATFYDAIMIFAKALVESANGTGKVLSCMHTNSNPVGYPNGTVLKVGIDFCNGLVESMTNATVRGASGNLSFDDAGDRIVQFDLYAMVNDSYQCVAEFDPVNRTYLPLMEPIPWPGGSKTPPLNIPTCGYDGKAEICATPFPTLEVALGVVIPVVLGFSVLAIHLIRLARKQAKSDHEWIVPLRHLKFHRTRKNDAVSHISEEHDDGHSMQGFSMGASCKGSMGQSMALTASMRKRFTAMSDHFGTWNKMPVVLRWTSRKRVVVSRQVILEVRVVRKTHHDNVARFLGGCVEDDNICILYEMCGKGPLDLMFEGDGGTKLDWTIRISWIRDIVNGMAYLHTSPIGAHTRFKSSTCFIDSRFVLKITDYGLASIFTPTVSEFWMAKRDPEFSATLLWTCPEKLRADASGALNFSCTKEGDVYSFGIILQEIIMRSKPYAMFNMTPNEIVDEVRKGMSLSGVPFRPKIPDQDVPPGMIELCTKCWSENIAERPSFEKIKTAVRNIGKAMNMGDQTNIMDVFMQQMEESGYLLQAAVEEKDNELLEQKIRSDEAFMKVFPRAVAERVMLNKRVQPTIHRNATLFLADLMGFETICVESQPAQITKLLDHFYGMLDSLIAGFDCFKVEHNGETVLVTAGIFGESAKQGARELARLALFSMVEIRRFIVPHRPNEQAKLRIALTSGPVVMATLNLAAPRFGICGLTLIIAKRLLQTCDQLQIHVAASTKSLLDAYRHFLFVPSPVSPISITNEEEMETFWLTDEEVRIRLCL
ncbi:atrial natriuretic peptide receptor 2-like isoform X2 [Paramacrobiotus metropolitanus]|uniref:atrial natriuretic peptide receptor 2-like isoform X2 n=1 Tax=Paramacrobiotus metropolitanus TaxID=2943436 RepID=UPI002445F5CD|nr:atrial natriuretic peptide receptor 2-like isoform X2 [Paramacrobiotus metropolitanus]